MARVGFLGCGVIGRAMARHIEKGGEHSVAFIQDPYWREDSAGGSGYPVTREPDETLYAEATLIVECATADALKQHLAMCVKHADLLVFSLTAFSDENFTQKAFAQCRAAGTTLYFPHGAILGLDGLFDARGLLTSVSIETTKPPQSLGRADVAREVVFEGCTRDACKRYPRNVNVHAAVALAGLGFDKTRSTIVSDPLARANTHRILADGEGVHFALEVSSTSGQGVTGQYTPISACGSLDRVLAGDAVYRFV
jgi:aspartate dehydrogenase